MLDRVFEAVLAAGGRGALLATFVWILLRAVGGRLTCRAKQGLWLLVLLRFCLPIAPQCLVSLEQAFRWTFASQVGWPAVPRTKHTPPPGEFEWTIRAEPSFTRVTDDASPDAVAEPAFNFLRIAALVWAAGAALGTIRLGVGVQFWRARLRRSPLFAAPALTRLLDDCRRRLGVRRPVRVGAAPWVSAPMVVGLFQPLVLLPLPLLANLRSDELRMVLLHELAHVRHWDVLWAWVAEIVRIVHWFNPCVWLARRGLDAAREAACDAVALDVVGAERRFDYGRTILQVLESGWGSAGIGSATVAGSVGMLGARRVLQGRIAMIASPKERRGTGAVWVGAAMLLTVGLVGLTNAAPPADKKKPPGDFSSLPRKGAPTAAKPAADIGGPAKQVWLQCRLVQATENVVEQAIVWDVESATVAASRPEPAVGVNDPDNALVAEVVVQRRTRCRLAFLGDVETTRLMDAVMSDKACNVLVAPKISILSGESGSIHVKRKVPFVTGYTPVCNGDAYDPVVETFDDGLTLSLTAVCGAPGFVRLRYAAEWAELNTEPAKYSFTRSCRFDPNSKERRLETMDVQTPETRLTRLNGAVTLPVGRTVAIDGLRRQHGKTSTPLVLLLTVLGVGNEPSGVKPGATSTKPPSPALATPPSAALFGR